MNRIVLCSALLLLCVCSVSGQSPWSYCPGTSHGHLTVLSVGMNPDPPVRGTDEIVSLVGTVDETITGGTIVLTITYGGFPVYNHTYNVCDTLVCPYTKPDVSSALLIPGTAIPPISPSGTYIGKANLLDQTGASLACIQVSFKLTVNEDAPKMSKKAAAELMALFNGIEF